MNPLKFFAEVSEPPTTTAQQKGARIVLPRGKKPFIIFYEKEKVVQAKQVWEAALRPYRPAAPMLGPVALTLGIELPYNSTDRAGVRKTGERIPHDTKPDVDNLAKMVVDSMTKLGFWHDDGQICVMRLIKRRGPAPGLYVEVSEGPTTIQEGQQSLF